MTGDLFDSAESCYPLDLPDAEIYYYPCFLNAEQADYYYHQLLEKVEWEQGTITVYGKQYSEPRLSAWYADQQRSYQYSGLRKNANPWLPELLELRSQLATVCDANFNSVLVNLYRNQQDSVGWHADDEPELGKNPVIASISLGQPRSFQLKHKKDKMLKQSLELGHGSLLVMAANTQHHWNHQVPKSTREMSPRINLTFRYVR